MYLKPKQSDIACTRHTCCSSHLNGSTGSAWCTPHTRPRWTTATRQPHPCRCPCPSGASLLMAACPPVPRCTQEILSAEPQCVCDAKDPMTAFGQHSTVPLFYANRASVALRACTVHTARTACRDPHCRGAPLQPLIIAVRNCHRPLRMASSAVCALTDGWCAINWASFLGRGPLHSQSAGVRCRPHGSPKSWPLSP